MTLNRQTLAKIDKQLLSQMDHDEGVQLVKVPVSEAVWSTWRRYCEAVGIPMGRALAVLLHQELAALVDHDLDRIGRMLGEREALVAAGEAAVDVREREVASREKALAIREQRLAAQTKPMGPHSRCPWPTLDATSCAGVGPGRSSSTAMAGVPELVI